MSKLIQNCQTGVENNGVVFIETHKYFKLGSGDIDTNCYDNFENFNYDCLSRIGAIRLLDAVSSTCQGDFLCGNCNDVKTKMPNSNRKRSAITTERRGSKYIDTVKAKTLRNRIYQNRNPNAYNNLNERHERDASDNIQDGCGHEREN